MQVAALLACGAAELSDPFFPAADATGTGAGAAGFVRRLLSRRTSTGAEDGAAAETISKLHAWELSPADLKAVRKAVASSAGGRGKRDPRQMAHTVVLPFSSPGIDAEGDSAARSGGTAASTGAFSAAPPAPGVDMWATGCSVTVDEFDYESDLTSLTSAAEAALSGSELPSVSPVQVAAASGAGPAAAAEQTIGLPAEGAASDAGGPVATALAGAAGSSTTSQMASNIAAFAAASGAGGYGASSFNPLVLISGAYIR